MIGIIILNYNTMFDTEKCVKTIQDNCILPIHFYIVDNDSKDGSYEYLYNLYKNENDVNVISSGKNGGYSFGNNVGIKTALFDNCDKIVICNSDVEVNKGAIESLSEAIDKYEEIGIITPKVLNADDTIMRQLRPAYDYSTYKSEEGFFFHKNYYYDVDKDEIMIFFGKVCGCFLMFRSKAIEKCNLYDERFFLFYEEDVIAYKMEEVGYKSAHLPTVSVKHWGGVSIKKSGMWFTRYQASISKFKLLKYYVKLDKFKLRLAQCRILLKFLFLGLKEHIYLNKIPLLRKELKAIYDEK